MSIISLFKKTGLFLFLLIILTGFFSKSVSAQEVVLDQNQDIEILEEVEKQVEDHKITLFYGIGCPHCEKARVFLEKLRQTHPKIEIEELEVYYNQENQELMLAAAHSFDITSTGVPLIIVDDQYIIGFGSEETTGERILGMLNLESIDESSANKNQQEKAESTETEITLPFFGKIDYRNFSLPFLTIVIAAVDGFNPCAMWTLIFLISLLLGFKDKKRMWTLGVLFIATSAAVYFLFLATWFNFFSYFMYVTWIKVIIGLVAFGVGVLYLKEAITNPSGACKVTNNQNHKEVFEKLKTITQKKSLLIAGLGIAGLAVVVNIVELACSAGLPAIYTQILSLSNLPIWQHYFYLLLYIFIFMLDDLFIFITAMLSLQVVATTGKYSQISRWIGGILLLLIGLILLIKPELLMIG